MQRLNIFAIVLVLIICTTLYLSIFEELYTSKTQHLETDSTKFDLIPNITIAECEPIKIEDCLVKFTPAVPYFIIPGSPKAGTTSLFFWLNQHPQLRSSKPKETYFFDKKPLPSTIPKYQQKYFSISKFVGDDFQQLTFETTPSYLKSETAAKQIAENTPWVKIIIILRDPIATLYSLWNMRHNYKPGKKHELDGFTYEGRKFKDILNPMDSDLNWYIGSTDFVKSIKLYRKYFNEKNMLILQSEDIWKNSQDNVNLITDFLGICRHNISAKPANVGKYKQPLIPKDVYENLTKFYSNQTSELNQLINKNFNWKNQWEKNLLNCDEELGCNPIEF